MCSCEDGDPVDVSVHERRKARKEHKCGECSRPIPVGTVHDYWRWLFEGSWESFRICPRCEVRRKAFSIAEGCRPMLGSLNETLRECAGEDPNFICDYLDARRKLRAGRLVVL